ncbi:MAG: ribosome silencing factor [Anaerolineae bacterium]|nr:ribosome silencing factor [Anaerolineae bacterium]
MEPIDLARAIIDEIEDIKGEDILLMDLREVSLIADYFVICTGNSERQIKAIVERVRTNIKKDHDIIPAHMEGDGTSGWTLLDYSDVVLHVFSEELRRYYSLESVWQEAKVLLRIQ